MLSVLHACCMEQSGRRGNARKSAVLNRKGLQHEKCGSRPLASGLKAADFCGKTDGGRKRNRTAVRGFAVPCIATLPSGPGSRAVLYADPPQEGQERAMPSFALPAIES